MIDRILQSKENCSGCHACYNICPEHCIAMVDDQEGFLYPYVDHDKCIKCSECIRACPIINRNEPNNEPSAYSCINTDEKVRMDSSSGGVFTLIAENILNEGGVVFGAAFNHDLVVEHCFIETKEELARLRGSKYVQSRIGDMYKQARYFLDSGREVLFSGTPCQISGLLCFLGKSYPGLFTVDIICHGVPSPKVWEKYIKFLEKEAGSKIEKISFRRKDKGWKRYSVAFLFVNGTIYIQPYYNDLYMKAFLKDICLRPSCYICAFKSLCRESDITVADFWGVQDILPDMDDDKGTSLIFVNSKKGRTMLSQIEENVLLKQVDIYQAIRCNPSAIKSAQHNKNRHDFFEKLNILPFDRLINDTINC